MRAYRIADRRFPILDGAGAQRVGGRWNSPGRAVIYAAESFAGSMLEILVHMGRLKLPKNRVYVEISIPETLIEEADAVPGWNAPDQIKSREFGDRWLRDARSLGLLVPSVVTHGVERNLLINPHHPAMEEVKVSAPADVVWDPRLF